MTVINTNVGALMARTYAARANEKMTTSMERLSSGLRINSAADDAAGLAVANKMQSQQRGINMAMRNSQDGISLVQTAESGMSEITNMILRMRELAVQMDNGIYTSVDRDNAQREINALLAEIDKIAANTRFNDVALLDGSYDQTIRAGNTNAETVRIAINSLFTADNGSSSIHGGPTSHSSPATLRMETGAGEYNIDPADLLKLQLGISSAVSSDLSATDSQFVLSDAVSSADFRGSGDNLLLLKDDVNGLGYTYAAVKLTDNQWSEVSSNLLQTRGLVEEMAALDPADTARLSQIQSSISRLETERSQFIGAQFHSDQIKDQGVFVEGGLTNNSYAEILNVYSDPATRQSVSQEIAAIEIDFKAMAATLHDPRTCSHCVAQAASGGGAGSEGVTSAGEYAAAAPSDYDQNGAGAVSASSPSSDAVSPLVKGVAWNDVGDDTAGGSLTYSYWDGTTSYDYDQGTRTVVGAHDAGGGENQAALDDVFGLWDAVTPFAFTEVVEGGDGSPVGDLRVAYTDENPAARQAFAYYPNSGASGGDIYFETDNVDTNGTGTDFVEGNYNYVAAIHEVGHALGLSHPFDGGSGDGSTMNLNIDFQRNTVMTYIQRDRNLVVQSDGSYSLVNSSTPGLLDIEAIGAIYGTDGWVHEATDTTYGAGSGSNLFDDSYNSIRVIVDSDGDDTFDASGVTATGSIINLTPGTYSSVGYYATDAEKIAAVAAGNAAVESFLTGVVESQDALASASNSYYTAYERESLYRGQDNVGIAYNTWIENAVGGDGDDTITGNSRANEITGNGGDDTIDGGAGDDVAIYSGNYATYTVTQSGSTVTVAGGTDATDTLTNVEFLKFDDGVWSIADAIAGEEAATHADIASAALADGADVVVTGGATYGDGATNVGGLALADIKVETKSDSQNAVTVLNRSLEQISSSRAKLGALMNRLQHNIDNQTKSSMMSQQARGRIVDSDMAVESTKLAQEMILSQAAQQAINMATQRQATVLQLLET